MVVVEKSISAQPRRGLVKEAIAELDLDSGDALPLTLCLFLLLSFHFNLNTGVVRGDGEFSFSAAIQELYEGNGA